MKIDIRGDIVDDDLVRFYEWWGAPCASPGTVGKLLKEAKDDEDVDVYINSPGGSVFAGAEIYELLRQHVVTVHITGLAASAASVVACAGARTLISPAGAVMIHNVSSWQAGDYRDMEQMAQTLRQVNRTIISAYTEKTGKNEEELQRLMDAETWMNAADCVANGFCDEIEARPAEKKQQGRKAASMGLTLTDEQIEKAKAAIAKEDAEKKAGAESSGEDLRRTKAKALLCLMRLREQYDRAHPGGK